MGGYNFFLGDRDPGNGVRGQRSREVPLLLILQSAQATRLAASTRESYGPGRHGKKRDVGGKDTGLLQSGRRGVEHVQRDRGENRSRAVLRECFARQGSESRGG